jgi:type I restriction enzyme S subunit
MVKPGDVLFALYGANSGDVAISRITGAINQAILCLRSKSSNEFLYQYLTHKKDQITSTYLQGGQGNLSGDIVKSIDIMVPSPSEQHRIASFLSSIDNLITAQSQKIESLKTHKKGLMQQLFPAMEEANA